MDQLIIDQLELQKSMTKQTQALLQKQMQGKTHETIESKASSKWQQMKLKMIQYKEKLRSH